MLISATKSPKVFIRLAVIAVVAVIVELVPLNRPANEVTLKQTTRDKQPARDEQTRFSRHLANNDITKLLGDLDNQTEAIKNGQEIGEELLGEKNKEYELDGTNNLFEKEHDHDNTEDTAEEVTDSSSQAVTAPEAPVLVDTNGVPDKTTAIESGANYMAGKPLLIVNKDSRDPDVNKWFLYYPLSTESDQQTA